MPLVCGRKRNTYVDGALMSEQYPYSAAERRPGRFAGAATAHPASIRTAFAASAAKPRPRSKGREAVESSQRAQKLLAEARSFKASRERQSAAQAARAAHDPLPLHTAAKENELDALRLLLARDGAAALVKVRSAQGQTALHYAARRGHDEAVRLLLSARADVDAREAGGWSPLMLAAKRGHETAVRALLSATPALELQTGAGLSALSLACVGGHRRAVAALVAAGVDAASADGDGWTPVHIAAKHGFVEVLRDLLSTERGKSAATGATQREGDTPLHLCCRRGHGALVPLLLAAGAEPGRRNLAQGQGPLHCAAWTGDCEALSALLAAKAEPDLCDADGETALHVAARHGQPDVIVALLMHGAQLGAVQATTGDTALHLASREGRLEAMEILLGAALPSLHAQPLPELRNKAGRTPQDEARRVHEASAEELLIRWSEAGALCASLQRLAFAALAQPRLGADSPVAAARLPWSLIRHAGGGTGRQLELHRWVLDTLAVRRCSTGSVLSHALGQRSLAERWAAASTARRWGGAVAGSAGGAAGEGLGQIGWGWSDAQLRN